jgi:malonyl-CoA O-methyltransferase
MSNFISATHAIQRDFSRAATHYHALATLQRAITQRAAATLAMQLAKASTPIIVEAGCGTGFFAQICTQDHPNWQLIQTDIAPNMLLQAAQFQPFATLCADMCALPVADSSVDAVFSCSSLQWVPEPARACKEFSRILRNAGVVCLTSFGPHTLQELHNTYSAHHINPPILSFPSLEELRQHLQDAGFHIQSSSSEIGIEIHADAYRLMRHLRHIGASHKSVTPRSRAQIQHLCRYYDAHFTTQNLPPHTIQTSCITPASTANPSPTVYASYEILTIIARNEKP